MGLRKLGARESWHRRGRAYCATKRAERTSARTARTGDGVVCESSADPTPLSGSTEAPHAGVIVESCGSPTLREPRLRPSNGAARVARERRWFEVSGRAGSLLDIVKAEGPSAASEGLLPLASLAPDPVASVLAGTQPVHVTTEVLTKRVDLPLDWKEQRSLLDFERTSTS